MKPAVRKLIERQFQSLNAHHPVRKDIVEWKMIGYGMALLNLNLIKASEYAKLFSDVTNVRTWYDRASNMMEKIMGVAASITCIASLYIIAVLLICGCVLVTMYAKTWLGF